MRPATSTGRAEDPLRSGTQRRARLGRSPVRGEWGKDFTQRGADAMLGRARDLGINLVDTAECYGDHVSEGLLEKAIAPDRDHWVVATKLGHRYLGGGRRRDECRLPRSSSSWSGRCGRWAPTASTCNSSIPGQTRCSTTTNCGRRWRVKREAGKIRHLSISLGDNAASYQTERATEVGADVIQVVYSRLDREPEKGVLPGCAAQELGVLAREALAGGLLSGKYAPGTQFTDPADTRSGRDQAQIQLRLHQARRIAEDEVPVGVDMATWALAWVLRQPVVTAVIPGCKSVAQVAANAAAADLELGDGNHDGTIR